MKLPHVLGAVVLAIAAFAGMARAAAPGNPLPVVPLAETTTGSASSEYRSDPGDPLGGGASESFQGPASVVSAGEIFIAMGALEITLSGPFGGRIQVGHYENVVPLNGDRTRARMRATLRGATCNFVEGTFDVLDIVYSPVGGVERMTATLVFRCVNGAGTPAPGKFGASFAYTEDAAQAPTPGTTSSAISPAGGTITMSVVGPGSCKLSEFTVLNPAATDLFNQPPAGLAYPRHGYVSFRVTGCTPGGQVTFTIDYPQVLPETAQWWSLGPTPDNRTNHWYQTPSTVTGSRITFSIVDGDTGDDDLGVNGTVRGFGMLSMPGGEFQDLWWAGDAENGWGISVIQHGDKLFANLFVYDAQGNPVWYVMPSGTWNGAGNEFTGALYLPTGSPFFAYDASRLNMGPSVGTMRLSFSDPNHAVFDYTINGVSGRKVLTRVPYAPQATSVGRPVGDLWWAGVSQNGWGLAILQKHTTLFALWFTYDENGKATWFVMPEVREVSRDTFNGKIFRPIGAAWLGVPYDAFRHRLVEVGSFGLQFGETGATFNYNVEGKTGSVFLTRVPF